MKFRKMSKQVLEFIGGVENIKFVEHCATRLRIHYANKDLIDAEAIKNVEHVMGLVNKTGQIQLIIGPEVNDAYNDFLDVSGWSHDSVKHTENEKIEKHGIVYWMNKFGNFAAPVFMPIVPAMIVGGLILAIKNLLVNYFGVDVDSGTAKIMLSIFDAGFTFLPVYLGYSVASQLKMQPVMGAFLGALLISSGINNVEGLDFLGIAIPQVSYGSTIMPVVFGVIFMYWVDKGLKRIIPKAVVFFLKPLLTMIIVVPVTLIILGPSGTYVSGVLAEFITWLHTDFGFIAIPVLSIINPYLVMLGLDKATAPIDMELYTGLGYNPLPYGFISNICVGAAALAVSTTVKDKAQRGMIISSGVTGLCGVTEPAFYGSLIMRPKALVGVGIGAGVAGLVAGILGLRTFVMGSCPGLLTLLCFVDLDGGLYYVFIAIITIIVGVVTTFIATKIMLSDKMSKKSKQENPETIEVGDAI